MMSPDFSRRHFLSQAGLATLGVMTLPSYAAEKNNCFSFILLGDLHYDKLKHHDFAWLEKHKAGDLRQIQNYSRITAEVTPLLLAAVKERLSLLNADPNTKAPFIIQVGDWVEGLCGSEELATLQNTEAVEFIQQSELDTPFLFTKGNHDVTGEGAEAAFAKVFHPYLTEQTRRLRTDAPALQKANYTVEQQDALFCFFDAYDNESLAWLEAALAKRTAQHCFVIVHPPVVPYGARSSWHLFAREKQKSQREKLLNLLGQNGAVVLGGHLHKFSSLVRKTPHGGRFSQLAVSSVVPSAEVKAKDVLSGDSYYTREQVSLEPRHSPETVDERRAVYDTEKAWVSAFEYGDLPGYTVVKVNGPEITAEIYSGVTQQLWKTVRLTS